MSNDRAFIPSQSRDPSPLLARVAGRTYCTTEPNLCIHEKQTNLLIPSEFRTGMLECGKTCSFRDIDGQHLQRLAGKLSQEDAISLLNSHSVTRKLVIGRKTS